jgi:hypothetical protein
MLTLLIIGTMFSAHSQTVIYVNKGAAANGNGTSWATAYNDLQVALTAAASMGGSKEIWVARGEYRPTAGVDRTIAFNLPPNTKVYGGFSATETTIGQRNHRVNRTVLSGDLGILFEKSDNSYHVVVAVNVNNNTVLDGFIITGGNASGAVGTIQGYGGGMLVHAAASATSPRITNCTFSNNNALSYGGGLANVSINDFGVNTVVENCHFVNNEAINGGGVCNYQSGLGSNPSFINCSFSSNKGSVGGAMNNFFCTATVINSTFTLNHASGGGAIYNFSTPQPVVIRNNIFWKNTKGTLQSPVYNQIENYFTETLPPIVQNNIIQGGYGVAADNNIDKDPLFNESPSGVGVYPRTSVLQAAWTKPEFENTYNLSGTIMPKSWTYYAYKDHQYNKLYITGEQLQVVDFNNLTNGLPTSTLIPGFSWGRISEIGKGIHNSENSIYLGSYYSGLMKIDRQTGVSANINVMAGEPVSSSAQLIQDVVVDNVNHLLYAPVFNNPIEYNLPGTYYGLLELNLQTNAKRWITQTSSPIALPEIFPGDDVSYWNGHHLLLDPVKNILYYSMGKGIWWWNRTTNATGVYNMTGGMPLSAGQPQLPSDLVTNMFIDEVENKFYIGTHAGLFVWNRTTNTSKIYNTTNSKLIENLINHISKNDEGHLLYVSTETGGLFVLNTLTGAQELWRGGENGRQGAYPGLIEDFVSSANYDKVDKKLYVSTFAMGGGIWIKDYGNLLEDFGDLQLQPNSPAIDAADNSSLPIDVSVDIDGLPRRTDFPSMNGTNALDLGAYEKFMECPPLPAANFSIEKSNSTFTFTPTMDQSSTSCQITYKWEFGDGQTSIEASPSHIYNNKGEFNVSLILSYKCGECQSVSDTVTRPLSIQGLCENIYCNGNGGVSIGTPVGATGYKLAVNGKMIAEGATVALKSRWPDYVFDPGYNLMSLPELKRYVKDNHHLPGVGSAAEVKNSGVDTGEMSTLLIRKTEELTLYFIALDERLRKLEAESKARRRDSNDSEKQAK